MICDLTLDARRTAGEQLAADLQAVLKFYDQGVAPEKFWDDPANPLTKKLDEGGKAE